MQIELTLHLTFWITKNSAKCFFTQKNGEQV